MTPPDLFRHTRGPKDAKIAIVGEARTIELTQGFVALVSPEDFDFLMQYEWYAQPGQWTVYAKTDAIAKSCYMHRLIMAPAPGHYVHHKNSNGLINTRENLTVVTPSANARNSALRSTKTSSIYRGVYRHRGIYFVAEITINYKKKYLGYFKSEQEAAIAYDKASLELCGPGFPLNFPESNYV